MKKYILPGLAAIGVTIAVAGTAVSFASAEQRASWGMGGGDHGWGHHRGHGGKHGRRGRRHMMREMMRSFDANGDRRVTQEEIDAGQRDLVTRFDTDGSGSISLDEFGPMMLEVRKRSVVRGFQRFDSDGDAEMTLEEFSEPFANVVARMDRNGDGAISREDRRGRWGRHGGRDGYGEERRERGGYDDRPAVEDLKPEGGLDDGAPLEDAQ